MENERKYRNSTYELQRFQTECGKKADIIQEEENFPVAGQRLQTESAHRKCPIQRMNKRSLHLHIFLWNFKILN